MQFKIASHKIQLPSWATAVGSAVLAVVGGLNVATFGLPAPWSQLVTFACAALAGIGLGPMTHAALRNALHLSMPAALTIAGAATTACAGVTTVSGVDSTLKGIIVGVLTGLAGVLVGPDAAPSPAPVPSPVPPTPPAPVVPSTQAKPKRPKDM